jgi:hypothetical protein
MKKKILLGAGALFAVVVVFFGYRIFFAPKASPPGQAVYSRGDLDLKVSYHRPYKKGRLIFGAKDAGALVPWGKYWRLGANAAAEMTFGKDAMFAGQKVTAGTYRLYAVPSEKSWKVVLNSELGKWGAFGPNHEKDILSVDVPVEQLPSPVEQFTIDFTPDGSGAKMELSWDTTRVRVPLQVK